MSAEVGDLALRIDLWLIKGMSRQRSNTLSSTNFVSIEGQRMDEREKNRRPDPPIEKRKRKKASLFPSFKGSLPMP